MKKQLKAFLMVLVLLCALGGMALAEEAGEAVYQNPVFNESFADPVIIRGEDGYIYAYATPDEWEDGTFHLCPILRTKDLLNWEYVGDVFEAVPSWNSGEGIWATEILKVGEKYVFYYTLVDTIGRTSIGAAVADHPAGPFVDNGEILTTSSFGGVYAIDPFPVYDEDGSLYLICGNYEQGSYIVPLTEDGLKMDGKKEPIAAGYEGVYIIKKDGFYYLFGSLGTVWEGEYSTYHVCVARSESLMGPYVNKAGEVLTEENKDETIILQASANKDTRFLGGPGNNSIIVDDNGVYWMVYHAVDSEKPYLPDGEGTRRPMCIDPIAWDEDGWPMINDGTPSLNGTLTPYFNWDE